MSKNPDDFLPRNIGLPQIGRNVLPRNKRVGYDDDATVRGSVGGSSAPSVSTIPIGRRSVGTAPPPAAVAATTTTTTTSRSAAAAAAEAAAEAEDVAEEAEDDADESLASQRTAAMPTTRTTTAAATSIGRNAEHEDSQDVDVSDFATISGWNHVVDPALLLRQQRDSAWRNAGPLDRFTRTGTTQDDMETMHELYHRAIVERHGDVVARFVSYVTGERYRNANSNVFYVKNRYFLRAMEQGNSSSFFVVSNQHQQNDDEAASAATADEGGRRVRLRVQQPQQTQQQQQQELQDAQATRAAKQTPWSVMVTFCTPALISSMETAWAEIFEEFAVRSLRRDTVLKHPTAWRFWAQWTIQHMREKDVLSGTLPGSSRDAISLNRVRLLRETQARLREYGWWKNSNSNSSGRSNDAIVGFVGGNFGSGISGGGYANWFVPEGTRDSYRWSNS